MMNKRTEKYLKNDNYYIDLYDLHTIQECLDYGNKLYAKLPEILKDPKLKDLAEEKITTDWKRSIYLVMHTIKIDRFKNKKQTIEEWMQNDRKKQERYDGAHEHEIYCPICSLLLETFMKTLHDFHDEPLRVLFFYECPKCDYREGRYDTDEKYEPRKERCTKCGGEIQTSIDINEQKQTTTWKSKCKNCDYENISVENDKEWREKQKQKKSHEKKLLTKYRAEFCFDEKEGHEAVLHLEQLINTVNKWKELDKKNKDPVYQKVRTLKELKIVEVRNLLKDMLSEKEYSNLQFEKPNMEKFVSVPFIVEDAKESRDKYSSRAELKKLLRAALEDTNWRLMSDGVAYRAGYLSGKLRCYENEEELAMLIKKNS